MFMYVMRSWREQKVMLKWRFPNLCDEDFVFEPGDKENMLTKLGIKLKKTRTELDLLFAEWQRY